MAECFQCGVEFTDEEEEIHELPMVSTGESELVCNTCFDNGGLTQCSHCSDWDTEPNMVRTRGMSLICTTCRDDDFFTCEHCGELTISDEAREINNGALLCNDCFSENTVECGGCCVVDHIDNFRYDSGDDMYYCYNCYNEDRIQEIPGTSFIKNKSQRKVGFEIEYFSPNSARSALAHLGHSHSDGSIHALTGYTGCEFASCASSGDQLVSLIFDVGRILRAHNAKVNVSCGLHVHLDMRKSTTAQRMNIRTWWTVFERLFFLIVSPSRRNNQFAEWVGGSKASRYGISRYQSLNIEAYDKWYTFEVRLHQGTTDPNKIWNWINLLITFFDTFQDINCSMERIHETEQMTERELFIFFFQQLNLPLHLRKYILKRSAQFSYKSKHLLYPVKTKRLVMKEEKEEVQYV